MIIHISPKQFRSVVSCGSISPKDDIAPVLAGVQISRTDNIITAVATDRYRVARVTFECHGDDFTALIPAAELTRFWAGIKTKALRSQSPIVLDISDDGYSIGYDGASISGNYISGNMPDVSKLVTEAAARDNAGAPEIGLNVGYIGDMGKLFHPADGTKPEQNWLLKFSVSDAGKAAPVYATRSGTNGGTLEYILQPVIIR